MLLNKQFKFFLIITKNPDIDVQMYRCIDIFMYKECLLVLSLEGLVNFSFVVLIWHEINTICSALVLSAPSALW